MKGEVCSRQDAVLVALAGSLVRNRHSLLRARSGPRWSGTSAGSRRCGRADLPARCGPEPAGDRTALVLGVADEGLHAPVERAGRQPRSRPTPWHRRADPSQQVRGTSPRCHQQQVDSAAGRGRAIRRMSWRFPLLPWVRTAPLSDPGACMTPAPSWQGLSTPSTSGHGATTPGTVVRWAGRR